MGAQIAAHLAGAGLEVLLLDIASKAGPKNQIVEAAFKRATKLKPAPFVQEAAKKRITLGNFDEHFDQLADKDWIIEVVVERMDIKQQVMARIEAVASDHAVISTNTSGLPINQIAEGRSEDFKRRFLGTHFFNPPRYLKLLEVIPTPDTDPAILERIQWFGRVHLGKGAVIAKDTPNFIGNRIGVYAIARTVQEFIEGRYTIEEIDALTGTLIGRPKSATFRTADVVGLDTLRHVISNLYDAVPGDESRETFQVPGLLNRLVEAGALGAKVKKGFYTKDRASGQIWSVNPETLAYEPAQDQNLGDLDAIKRAGDLGARINALYADEGRAGQFFRDVMLDTMAYAARRIPEIADRPIDVDHAICWGFGYEVGPFQTWDLLGFEKVYADLQAAGTDLPDWVHQMQADGIPSFYQSDDGTTQGYVPALGTYQPIEQHADEISLPYIKTDPKRVVWKNADAALLDMGDDVVLYEFRSKSNSLGTDVMQGLFEVIDLVEHGSYRGLVIGNAGKNFTVGANLGELAMGVMMGQFDQIEMMVARFQEGIQRVRYAEKPVVVCTHQMVLGGGCEMVMASSHPVAASESYIGMVELGAGLIPAGTGTTHMTAWAAEKAASDFPSHIQPFLRQAFEMIAMAKVATSAREAQDFGILPPHTKVVMNADRRFHVAKEEVVRLSNQGYLPPPRRSAVRVLGRGVHALFEAALYQFKSGNYISEYDQHLAERLAYVMAGGNLTGPTDVHEDYLIELEREVFLSLLGEEKTLARIQHILTTNKPLRN